MKIRIFVSYCRADIQADDLRLEVLLEALERVGRGTYDVLVDRNHERASVGANLVSFMQQIDTSDAVILLLTPGYKSRVLKREDTGVYFEYKRILDRYLEAEERNTYGTSFLVVPLIFSGDSETSYPHDLRNLKYESLEWLNVVPQSRSGRLRLRKQAKARLNHLTDEIGERIAAVAATRARQYRERQEKLFRDFLFHDTKSRWDKPENYRYLDSAFVKTSTFLKARNREINFLIGRKGSGKSTITHVLPILMIPPPAHLVRIEFEDIVFQLCFNILQSKPAEASDLRNAFSPLHSYELVWDIFLHLYFSWTICSQLNPRTRLYQVVKKAFPDEAWAELDQKGAHSLATKVLFVHAFEHVVSFIEEIVTGLGPEEGFAAAVGRFTPQALRRRVFGKRGWRSLESILTANRNASETALVTADGFDVMVGYFAEAATSRLAADQFERELLLSLFQIVLNGGPGRVVGGSLYEITEFCIAIPHDRFLEVRGHDRDQYQYRYRFARISWSGIELSALVRKRLALLRKVADEKGPALEERLAKVMRRGYPELPNEIQFRFGNARYRMPLFLYVLRHTFWRPRDILFYYASLLAASEEFRRKELLMPEAFVRQIIAGATRTVVENEFLKEYSASFRNIGEVIDRLRGAPQVISWEDLNERVGNLEFDTNICRDGEATFDWKIEVLYEIGVLGVFLDRNVSERYSVFRHAFVFNEGDVLTEKLSRAEYRRLSFLVHPIFCETLHIDTDANPELILPLDWSYLHKNEIVRGIMHP